jgi:hypothetical protein
MMTKYRVHLNSFYKGGQREVKDSLVFAHSDVSSPDIAYIDVTNTLADSIWKHSSYSP